MVSSIFWLFAALEFSGDPCHALVNMFTLPMGGLSSIVSCLGGCSGTPRGFGGGNGRYLGGDQRGPLLQRKWFNLPSEEPLDFIL